MIYELFRVPGLSGCPEDGTSLGLVPEYDAALVARDDALLGEFEETAGALIEVTHLIVGPGADRPPTCHPVVSRVGGDLDRFGDLTELLADYRRWLDVIRGRRR